MEAKTKALLVSLAVSGAVFSAAYAQSNNNTVHVDSSGGITSQNPSNWVLAVRVQSDQEGTGAASAYQVLFLGAAPSASSCTAMPDTSGLTGLVEAAAAQPNQLLVSFRPSGNEGGQITPSASAFTLSCERTSN